MAGSDDKKDFSGFLNKILFSEDKTSPPEKPKEKTEEKQFMPAAGKTENRTQNPEDIDKELVEKIHDFLKSIDSPGVDFLELWNVASAMDGGANQQNIKNAYTTLKIVSQNQLTLSHIESTGLNYKSQIEELIKKDIAKKEQEKERILQEISLKKSELEDKIRSYKQQLQTVKSQLESTENQLNQFSKSYEPQIAEIDKKISAGVKASNSVVNQIASLLSLIKSTIKE
jgi:DNA repair exonuclease SbcCD ATPase subunit